VRMKNALLSLISLTCFFGVSQNTLNATVPDYDLVIEDVTNGSPTVLQQGNYELYSSIKPWGGVLTRPATKSTGDRDFTIYPGSAVTGESIEYASTATPGSFYLGKVVFMQWGPNWDLYPVETDVDENLVYYTPTYNVRTETDPTINANDSDAHDFAYDGDLGLDLELVYMDPSGTTTSAESDWYHVTTTTGTGRHLINYSTISGVVGELYQQLYDSYQSKGETLPPLNTSHSSFGFQAYISSLSVAEWELPHHTISSPYGSVVPIRIALTPGCELETEAYGDFCKVKILENNGSDSRYFYAKRLSDGTIENNGIYYGNGSIQVLWDGKFYNGTLPADPLPGSDDPNGYYVEIETRLKDYRRNPSMPSVAYYDTFHFTSNQDDAVGYHGDVPPGEDQIPPETTLEDTATDPLNLFNGEYTKSVQDAYVEGREVDFVWNRFYRSKLDWDSTHESGMGDQWDHNYNIYIEKDRASGSLILHRGDARDITYEIQSHEYGGKTIWKANGYFSQIEKEDHEPFVLVFSDKSQWEFENTFDVDETIDSYVALGDSYQDAYGNMITDWVDDEEWITQIQDIQGRLSTNTMSFSYTSGLLTQITDSLGRTFTIDYYDAAPKLGLIETITENFGNGRVWSYYYNSYRQLTEVKLPPQTGLDTDHNYADGKTVAYRYGGTTSPAQMTEVYCGNNVSWSAGSPVLGDPFLSNTYTTGRVTRQLWGTDSGLNNVVDITYITATDAQVLDLPNNPTGYYGARTLAIVNDREGNVTHNYFNSGNQLTCKRTYTGRATNYQVTTLATNRPGTKVRSSGSDYWDEDPESFETVYKFNSKMQLSMVIHDDNRMETFSYDDNGNVTKKAVVSNVLEDGSYPELSETYEYDCPFNFPSKHTDPLGNVVNFEYTSSGDLRTTEHVDPVGTEDVVDEYTYNQYGYIETHTHPKNPDGTRRDDKYVYYALNEDMGSGSAISSSTALTPFIKEKIENYVLSGSGADENLTTRYYYDKNGNNIGWVEPEYLTTAPSTLSGALSASNKETRVYYNTLGFPYRIISPPVETSQESGGSFLTGRYQKDIYYDGNNMIEKVATKVVDADGTSFSGSDDENAYTEYTRDSLNNVTLVQEKIGVDGTSTDILNKIESSYSPNRHLISEVFYDDVSGVETAVMQNDFAYDERGLVFQQKEGSLDFEEEKSTFYSYDVAGNLSRVTTGVANENNLINNQSADLLETTQYSLDEFGRVAEIEDHGGNINHLVYDDASNLISNYVVGETGRNGDHSTVNQVLTYEVYEWDFMARMTKVRAPLGGPDYSIYNTVDGVSFDTSVLTVDYEHTGSSANCDVDVSGSRLFVDVPASEYVTISWPIPSTTSPIAKTALQINGDLENFFLSMGVNTLSTEVYATMTIKGPYIYGTDWVLSTDVNISRNFILDPDEENPHEVYPDIYFYQNDLNSPISLTEHSSGSAQYYVEVSFISPDSSAFSFYLSDIDLRKRWDADNRTFTGDLPGATDLVDMRIYDYAPNSLVEDITDANGKITSLEYDGLDRLIKQTDPHGSEVVLGYDDNGNLTREDSDDYQDSTGLKVLSRIDYEYDPLSRLRKTLNKGLNGIQTVLVSEMWYDSRDNMTIMMDARGNRSLFEFDPRNELLGSIRQEDVSGTFTNVMEVSYDRDDLGRVATITDGNSNSTTYTYDNRNRLSTIEYADSSQAVFSREFHDRDLGVTLPSGQSFFNWSDYRGLVTHRTYGGSESCVMQYDGVGRLVWSNRGINADYWNIQEFSYSFNSDLLAEWSQLQRIESPGFVYFNMITEGEIDAEGNYTKLDYPSIAGAEYIYDEINRANYVKMRTNDTTLDNLMDYDYIGSGYRYDKTTQISDLVNQATEYSYDVYNRVSRINNSSDDIDMDQGYSWDDVHSRESRQYNHLTTPLTYDYEFDAINQLEMSTRTKGTSTYERTYHLDEVGNRDHIQAVIDGDINNPVTFSYDMDTSTDDPELNQYSETPDDYRIYNENGQLTEIWNKATPSVQIAELTYNAKGDLIEYEDLANSHNHVYNYDGLGRRVRKVVNEGEVDEKEILFVWFGDLLIEEYEVESNEAVLKRSYVYGAKLDEVLCTIIWPEIEGNQADYLFHYNDDQLSPGMIRKKSAEYVNDEWVWSEDATQSYYYDDFGVGVDANGDALTSGVFEDFENNPIGFTGRYYDFETGLYHYRSRYYDAKVGRFISRDSIGAWGDPSANGNSFTYVGNNPFSGVDPFGLWKVVWNPLTWGDSGEWSFSGGKGSATAAAIGFSDGCRRAANHLSGGLTNFEEWDGKTPHHYSETIALYTADFALMVASGGSSAGALHFPKVLKGMQYFNTAVDMAGGAQAIYNLATIKEMSGGDLFFNGVQIVGMLAGLNNVGKWSRAANKVDGLPKHKPNNFSKGGKGGCFLEGTLVETADGQVAIEDVELGTAVLTEPDEVESAEETETAEGSTEDNWDLQGEKNQESDSVKDEELALVLN
jgi:RHS repeat-associated protein